MTSYDREGWQNHAHWDHSAEPAPPRPPGRIRRLLSLELRRAHLPAHPAASFAAIAAGLGYLVLMRPAMADLAVITLGGDRALRVAAAVVWVVMTFPGLGLVLTGAWDLLRRLRGRETRS